MGELKRENELEAENTTLKRVYSDLAWENQAPNAALNEVMATRQRWDFWRCFDRMRLLGHDWNHERGQLTIS